MLGTRLAARMGIPVPRTEVVEVSRDLIDLTADLVMQLGMVAAVIAFPGMVLGSLDKGPKIDPTKIQIELPQLSPGSDNPQIQFK